MKILIFLKPVFSNRKEVKRVNIPVTIYVVLQVLLLDFVFTCIFGVIVKFIVEKPFVRLV